MRTRLLAAFLVAAALAGGSAPAQAPQTETQERQKSSGDSDLIWNLVGCLGLLGVFGMWRSSDNDGYTADPI